MSKSNIESYPPLFRESSIDTTQQLDLNSNEESKEAGTVSVDLPCIDMECLDVEKLDRACREWGIFRLENHGVPIVVLSQLQEHAKRIFKLPFETKQGIANSSCPIKYFWGTPALTSSGVALIRPTDAFNMDWVEGLNLPFSQLHHHHHHHNHLLINDFRNLLEDYKGHLTRIASTIFKAIIGNLKLNLRAIKPCLDVSTGLIRVYRYPSYGNAEHVKGLHEHTDSSIFSLLNEDQVGGLQFLKNEQWFKVKPIPSTLVVNLGDMMQVLSDDKYKSVKHKVELNKDNERVSICYFVFPEENTLIQSSRYKPFTYNDFRAQVQRDLKTHGYKLGLYNFKLQQ